MSNVVPYRSRRRLAGLHGSGDSAAYAQALYQAYRGDVAGGAYNAFLTFAGPIAAIGNAIANFANRAKDVKSGATQAMLDALVEAGVLKQISAGRAGNHYLTPMCTLLDPDEKARAVSEAIRLQKSPEDVAAAFKNWFESGVPFKGVGVYAGFCSGPILDATVVTSASPTPSPTVAPPPSPAPSAPPVSDLAPNPAPVAVLREPVPGYAVAPGVSASPASTADASTLAPDLVAQLLAQGASQQSAYTAALQMLAARGVPPTNATRQTVSNAIVRAKNPPVSSTVLIVLTLAAMGFAMWAWRS